MTSPAIQAADKAQKASRNVSEVSYFVFEMFLFVASKTQRERGESFQRSELQAKTEWSENGTEFQAMFNLDSRFLLFLSLSLFLLCLNAMRFNWNKEKNQFGWQEVKTVILPVK